MYSSRNLIHQLRARARDPRCLVTYCPVRDILIVPIKINEDETRNLVL